MRKYPMGYGSRKRMRWVHERCLGLKKVEKLAHLAVPLEAQNRALLATVIEREAAEEQLLPAIIEVRFAELANDQTVQGVNFGAATTDNHRSGPTARELFPEGVSEVVAPRGEAQLEATQKLLRVMRASTTPSVIRLREEWLPKLQKACDDLGAALAMRKKAYEHVGEKRALEEAAKADHALALERFLGEFRALTASPADRGLREAIFPPESSSRRDDEDSENPEDEPS